MNNFEERPQYEIDLELALERFRAILKELADQERMAVTRSEVPIVNTRKEAA